MVRFGERRSGAIVLVHGAWVGEWSWLPITDRLAALGRSDVYVVSLTGHGSQRHRSGPHVTLSDHVADVVNVVENFDLDAITLVGHSYGGRVITKAYPQLQDRIAAMVYVDAHTPVTNTDPPQSPERLAAVEANGGMLPMVGYGPDPSLLGSEEAVQWFLERTMHQSFACFTEPWRTLLPDALPKTFVYATENQPSRFEEYASVCRDDPSWRYRELPGPHWLMMSHTNELAEIILSAAGDKPSTLR